LVHVKTPFYFFNPPLPCWGFVSLFSPDLCVTPVPSLFNGINSLSQVQASLHIILNPSFPLTTVLTHFSPPQVDALVHYLVPPFTPPLKLSPCFQLHGDYFAICNPPFSPPFNVSFFTPSPRNTSSQRLQSLPLVSPRFWPFFPGSFIVPHVWPLGPFCGEIEV